MPVTFLDKLKRGWNVFQGNDTLRNDIRGSSYSYRPDRVRFMPGTERTIITSVYNRMAIDVAAVDIFHVRLDENKRYAETIDSGLNQCLTLEANIDQTGRAFIMDAIMSMFDEGSVAMVPIDTSTSTFNSLSFDIHSIRTGKIVQWYPRHVKVHLYNDITGQFEDVVVPKATVAIVENPLYAVMNEPNSTLQRLIYKLGLLDAIDKQSGSGKLDLIIQMPYVLKNETRKKKAEERRDDIVEQLNGSAYGIAYTDGAEKITQLNRPSENNLMAQIEYLTRTLYGQLGLTPAIFDGTASESEMLNYYDRTVEPILTAITVEMKRKFLTKTARSQGQSISYFRDMFKLVPASDLAEMADKFTRNEIMSANEFRSILGYKPDKSPKSDELRNSNLNSPEDSPKKEGESKKETDINDNGSKV